MVTPKASSYIEKAALSIIGAIRHKIEKGPVSVALFGPFNCQAKEIGEAIIRILNEEDFSSLLISQDDYFRLTPSANLNKRIEDPAWFGVNEIRLELMDTQIHKIVKGKGPIEKPVIVPGDERFETEQIPNFHYDLVLAYGCYTGFLEHIDFKVFIEPEAPSSIPDSNPLFHNLYETEKAWVAKQRPMANLEIHP